MIIQLGASYDYSAQMNYFYLQPTSTPNSSCWYTSKPIGHNTITKTLSMQAMCSCWYKTRPFTWSHSCNKALSRSRGTAGDGEDRPQEFYKCTTNEQREALSDILNRKEPRPDTSQAVERFCPQQSTSTHCRILILVHPLNNFHLLVPLQTFKQTQKTAYLEVLTSILVLQSLLKFLWIPL